MAGQLQGPEGRKNTRVGRDGGYRAGGAVSSRSARRPRRGTPLDPPAEQAPHIQRMGRLVCGAAIKASFSKRRQPPTEPQRFEVSETGVRQDRVVGYLHRSDRKLPRRSASIRAPYSNEVRARIAGNHQASYRPPGVPDLVAYPERRGETEAARRKPMSGGRISGLGPEVN